MVAWAKWFPARCQADFRQSYGDGKVAVETESTTSHASYTLTVIQQSKVARGWKYGRAKSTTHEEER